MNKRLLQFIDAENLSQSQFADILGVARASISHILSGRNRPGYDFIESIMLHFPSLNMEWLITGQGKMYKSLSGPSQTNAPVSDTVIEEDDLFANLNTPAKVADPEPKTVLTNQVKETVSNTAVAATPSSANGPAVKSGKSVVKIIILYNDGTYQDVIVA